VFTARTRSPLTAFVALPILFGSGFAHAHPPSPPPGQTVSQEARERGEQLTVELVRLNTVYQLTPAAQKPQVERQLLSAATARAQELLGLMESAPDEALRLAVPADVRANLPASVQAHVEQEADIEGTIEILHEDNTSGGRYHYSLDTGAARLTLRFADSAPDDVLTGARVRAHGVQLEQTLALDGSGSIQLVTTALPNTFGALKTLVILVNFSDLATQPYTVDSAKSVVFATTSNFDMENSYGRTSLTGDVVGWYTIPMSSTVCDYNTLATYATQAAMAAGVNVSSYARLIFAFPNNACTWWGLGTVGGSPARAWINGSFELRVVGHETGHNLGLYHSHNYDCGTVVLGAPCTVSEYGDTIDIMGSASGHYNAFQKERLGWLNYGSSPPLYTVTTSGTYVIDPYESLTSNPKGLKLVQSVDPSTGRKTWYYVEYRQGVGFDGFVGSNANLKSGIVIHLGTDGSGNSSYLLDLTPATSSWFDPALDVGQSYADPAAGVTIAPLWADTTGAGVSVAFVTPACAPAAPAMTLSPAQSPWLAPGAAATFTARITNADSQGCAASTFNLQGAVPSGWAGGLGASSLTLAPGAAGSASFTVTSPASATNGFYTVTVNASDAAQPTHLGSASATDVVMSSLTTTVATNQLTYNRPETVTITTTVLANGAPVSGASVSVTVTKSNGASTKLAATTGASGVAMVTLSLKQKDPAGTYQVVSTATVTGGLSGQAKATFGVK
jgi:hypothetical protein